MIEFNTWLNCMAYLCLFVCVYVCGLVQKAIYFTHPLGIVSQMYNKILTNNMNRKCG